MFVFVLSRVALNVTQFLQLQQSQFVTQLIAAICIYLVLISVCSLFVELASTLFDRHLAVQLLFRSCRRLEPIFLTKVNIPDVWKIVHCKPMFYMISNFSLPELCLYAPLFS